MATYTKEQMRQVLEQLMSNKEIADQVKATVDVNKLTRSRGKSNPEILAEAMRGKGLVDRDFMMTTLGFDAEPETEEYKAASRNLSSVLTAIKKLHILYEYEGRYAILTEEQQAELRAWHETLA